jgi:hypothetical protein
MEVKQLAEEFLFFDSVDNDRQYFSSDFSKAFQAVVANNGIIRNMNDELIAAAGVGLEVIVNIGKAWIQGRFYSNNSALPLIVPSADSNYSRIDRVVIRLNLNIEERNIKVAIKTGNPIATPVAPDLQRDASIWELSLAQYVVEANANTLTNFIDERNVSTLCGFLPRLATQISDGLMSNQDKIDLETSKQSISTINGNIGSINSDINSINSNISSLSATIPYRNYIINGNFDVWQRGVNFSASGYTADRWDGQMAGSSMVVSKQDFILGQGIVPNEPVSFLRCAVTSIRGANNGCTIQQNIENVRSLAGKTVTLSFWGKADSNRNIAIEFYQAFGTGGSPSTNITGIGITKFALTTSWAKYTTTVTIPSIAGKTLGSNNNSLLAVLFWFDAGSGNNSRSGNLGQQSGTFDIAQVQLEEGSVATNFEERPLGLELSLCQRYYCNIVCGGIAIATTGVLMNTKFPITMRSAPTIRISYNNSNWHIRDATNGAEVDMSGGSPYAWNMNTDGFTGITGNLASLTIGHGYDCNCIVDAEL